MKSCPVLATYNSVRTFGSTFPLKQSCLPRLHATQTSCLNHTDPDDMWLWWTHVEFTEFTAKLIISCYYGLSHTHTRTQQLFIFKITFYWLPGGKFITWTNFHLDFMVSHNQNVFILQACLQWTGSSCEEAIIGRERTNILFIILTNL